MLQVNQALINDFVSWCDTSIILLPHQDTEQLSRWPLTSA